MTIAADPVTVAVALGLLSDVALEDGSAPVRRRNVGKGTPEYSAPDLSPSTWPGLRWQGATTRFRIRGGGVAQTVQPDPPSALAQLVGFSRLLASALEPADVLSQLATAVSCLDVGAAAVIGTSGGEAPRVLEVRGLPERLIGVTSAAEDIDSEFIQLLIDASDGRCVGARTYPLVSGGGLYGALVLLDEGATEPDPAREELAEAMTNLAAVALNKAFHEAELRRTLDDLRQSREALLRSERLKILGEMAAVVTHEVRNPLAAMGGALQILEGRLAAAPAERKIVRMVLDRLAGLNAMITELLTYARPKEPSFGAIELAQFAREAVESAQADPASAGIVFKVAGSPVSCRGDRGQLSGVVLNLILNATQAMRGSGEITLLATRSPGWSELSVSDNGPGVPEELRARIFEPFFTTRGGGTGLGLAIARGVIERHDGQLDLLNPPGGGAVFRIRLPA